MSSIFDSILTGDMTLTVYLILLGSSIILGILNALASSFRNRSGRTFYSALVLLPPTVLTVVTMVNGNVGTGIAVAGSFSLLKFRSAPAKARDLMSIFISMASGLCCAAGYVGIAFLFTVIICSISMLLAVLNTTGAEKKILSITIPETLSINGAFDDVFEKYTASHELRKLKTTNLGSLYRLRYEIMIKNKDHIQNMIDELRVRNGNLEISITSDTEEEEMI
ncbi:MAG: DUF4956 domain-containing protein [Clostridia bacterium]|nr:DUF4956 domain-containing protein [Clostridia bacterium]